MSETKSRKVSVQLSNELLKGLDAEVKRLKSLNPKSRVTRGDALRTLVLRHTRDYPLSEGERRKLYAEFLRESGPLKLQALGAMADKDYQRARKAYLRAAALELEALAVLEAPSEQTTANALVEIVFLVKKATGYRTLPDTPRIIVNKDMPT